MKSGVGLPQRIRRGRRRVLPGHSAVSTVAAVTLVAAGLTLAGSTTVGAVGAPASDFDGDGRADIVLAVPGEDVGDAQDAGVVTVVYGSRSGLDRGTSQTIQQGASGVTGTAEAGDHFGRAWATGDFNGDGYADLVVGAPNEAVGDIDAAGSITVVYGGPSGLTGTGSAAFNQGGSVAGQAETGDRFGAAIATGDFDGDGYDDVAAGAPGEDVGSVVDAGDITILYGGGSGLQAARSRAFSQAGGVAGIAQRDDRFGAAVTSGDFDNDGRDDLAVGAPGQDLRGRADAGAVTVLYGSGAGIAPSRSQQFSQFGKIKGKPQANDQFGSAVAAGDFNGDGRDDLAVGVPGEDLPRGADAGQVNILYAGPSGLRKLGNARFSQAGKVNGVVQAGDRFGAALAVGDFDGNGRDDLAIGVPGEDVGNDTDAGSVNVLYGKAGGLRVAGDFDFGQGGSMRGSAEDHDLLGSSVTALDLDGDGYDDVVAGVPGEDQSGVVDAGVAAVVYGGNGGLSPAGNESVSQAGAVAGVAEAGDGLGQPQYETWLDRVNLYRSQAGLDPVSERADLSSDAVAHSRWMVLNGTVAHSETPGTPGYSNAGNASGGRSNVYGTTLASARDVSAVDGWVTGPFHAVGFLTPSLIEVGYGSYRDPGASYIRMAASLDIYGAAREWNKTAGQPYTWPGDGSVVPVRSHINEWPSPTTHCPGHRGLPVIAFFETSVNVTNHTFTTGDQQPVDHCVFDGTDYKNPDGNARNLGRSILGGANAVVLMPDEPLLPGEQYCFSVTSRGVTTDACFTVDPNA